MHDCGHLRRVDRSRTGADRQDQRVASVRRSGNQSVGGEQPLDPVQVDPEPEHLGHPRAAADDLEEPVLALTADVAGAQLVHRAAQRQVGGALGVPEHHVVPAIDQLTDLRLARPGQRSLGQRLDGEGAAGDRDADRLGSVGGQQRRQPGHPGGRLGGAVHHHEVPAAALSEQGVAADGLGSHPPTGLGDPAQRGQVHLGEADPVEQLERVGHAREGGDPVRAAQLPEGGVRDRLVREQQRGAARGDGCARPTGRSSSASATWSPRRRTSSIVEVLGDGSGVGQQVRPREPDQLRGAGGARGRHQQREVGVELDSRVGAQLDETVGAGPRHVRVVRRREGLALQSRAGQQHRAVRGERAEVGDQRVGVVAALDHDQPASGAEPAGEASHATGQVGVRQTSVRGAVPQQRDAVAVRREAGDQR